MRGKVGGMSSFARSFPVRSLTDEVIERNPWFGDLLRHWRPAGDALVSQGRVAEEDLRLRLAIRADCVNFYRSGQSVAKVYLDSRDGLQALIHNKYVNGQASNGKHYLRVTSAGVSNRKMNIEEAYGGTEEMRRWIANANDHAGREKKFVDLVVAHNPNTIDLEMALPADSTDRRSPRMDLVALERSGERWRIVFWEAKLVDDGRARCSGDALPKVVEQLRQYTCWLRRNDNCRRVLLEYQKACRLLVEFRDLAARVNPDIGELGPGIIAVAASDESGLCLDDVPRLLIDDRTADARFTDNGHLKKLRAMCGSHVQMVRGLHDMTLEVRP
jgi:hypothetical protein